MYNIKIVFKDIKQHGLNGSRQKKKQIPSESVAARLVKLPAAEVDLRRHKEFLSLSPLSFLAFPSFFLSLPSLHLLFPTDTYLVVPYRFCIKSLAVVILIRVKEEDEESKDRDALHEGSVRPEDPQKA